MENSKDKTQILEIFSYFRNRKNLFDVILRFYTKMEKDLLIGFFFTGKNLEHIASQQTDFLLRAMGVTHEFKGKGPAQAHDKIPPILQGHFDRRLRLLEETLREVNLPPKLIQAWIQFEENFRSVVVQEESPISKR